MTLAIERPGAARKTKRAISLPEDVARAVDRKVEAGVAPSFSAFVVEALRDKLEQGALDRVLEELAAEHGQPSSEDYAWARRALGV